MIFKESLISLMYNNNHHKSIFSEKLFLIIGIALFCLLPFNTNAQQTATGSVAKNKSLSFFSDSTHSPKKAMLLSAIIPGTGQIYNKKYWKLPLVYASFAGLGYSFILNNSQFLKYKNEYIFRKLNPTIKPNAGEYTTDQLNLLQESYHRYRDLSAIGIFAFYALNIIDAGVDAHLINFNVDDNLSLKIQPTFYQAFSRMEPALGLDLTWKF